MSETTTNEIWKKTELALVDFINAESIGLNEANLYAGHENNQRKRPYVVCDCHEGEPDITGRVTGNWKVKATILIEIALGDETGEDLSGRFASVMDAFSTDEVPALLSSETIIYTCFFFQITGFMKRTIGDGCQCEINLELTCCGSVVS